MDKLDRKTRAHILTYTEEVTAEGAGWGCGSVVGSCLACTRLCLASNTSTRKQKSNTRPKEGENINIHSSHL